MQAENLIYRQWGEYIGLRTFLSSHGISHMTSPPHTPEHNGIAERRHRHIVETGLALLSHASMPRSYWTYAFGVAVYLINRMPTPNLNFNNPFQNLYGYPPNFEKLRVYGCLCFPWLKPYNSHKLEARSTPCVFLGYSPSQSAYFCLDRSTNRVYTSWHVMFHENVFPFTISSPITVHDDTLGVDHGTSSSSPLVTLIPQINGHHSPTITPAPVALSQPPEQTSSAFENPSSSTIPPVADLQPQPSTNDVTSTPTQLEVTETVTEQPPPPPAQPVRTSNRIKKPVQNLNLHTKISPASETIPRTVAEALKSEKWRKAMLEEINSHIRNHTWDLTNSVAAANVVGCR